MLKILLKKKKRMVKDYLVRPRRKGEKGTKDPEGQT